MRAKSHTLNNLKGNRAVPGLLRGLLRRTAGKRMSYSRSIAGELNGDRNANRYTSSGSWAELAPSGWNFTTKLKIGFGYFNRVVANSAVMLSADVISFLMAFQIAAFLRLKFVGSAMSPEWSGVFLVIWVLGAAAWGLLPGWGQSPVESLRRQVLLVAITFAGTAVFVFMSKSATETSRLTMALAFLISVPLVPMMRNLAKRVLMKTNGWGIPVAIYGGGATGHNVIRRLKEEPGHGYYPVCVFDDNPELAGTMVENVPVVGRTDSVALDVPLAILAMTKINSMRISELMEGPLSNYLRVIMIPNLVHAPALWATSRDLSGVPGLELSNNLLDPGKRFLKGSIEMGLTVLTLPLWGPLCGLISLAIWLEDRNDPIFKQPRIGKRKEVFKVWKFRTMVPNAEAVLKQKLEEDPVLREEWEKNCKLMNDPRITKVGNFLRKTSLDELPQLINVLRGQMSLVGPRPLPDYHHKQLPEAVRGLRERVRPGMTGLWQVSGRSDAGNEGMVLWDPYYVRNWSPWLDIVICVRTIRVVLRGSGAR